MVNNLEEAKNRLKIRAGEIRAVNTKKARGHYGLTFKIRKNGIVETGIFTHGKRTFGKKNIRLQENPNPNDKRTAFVVKKKQVANAKQLGRKREDMTIKNPIDKSIMRHIKKHT